MFNLSSKSSIVKVTLKERPILIASDLKYLCKHLVETSANNTPRRKARNVPFEYKRRRQYS